MLELILDGLSMLCLIGGGIFGILGGVGLLRFPDFYSRLHAAGVTDTLSALLIVLGLALQSGISLLTLKLLLILLFLLFTTPTASHALAQAALTAGVSLGRAADKDSDEEEPPSST
jgi:multicomponent Na+:H+ antiporter subunit G